jgi:hypothetical protein
MSDSGSGGTLSVAVRSGLRARLNAADVRECRTTAASPDCALSSHWVIRGSMAQLICQAKSPCAPAPDSGSGAEYVPKSTPLTQTNGLAQTSRDPT